MYPPVSCSIALIAPTAAEHKEWFVYYGRGLHLHVILRSMYDIVASHVDNYGYKNG